MQSSTCRETQHFRWTPLQCNQAKLGDLDTGLLLIPPFFVHCAPWGAELFPWAVSVPPSVTFLLPLLTSPLLVTGSPTLPRAAPRKEIHSFASPDGRKEKGQRAGLAGPAQGPAQPTRVTFMTGWAKYLALQSQKPVCTAAEMKLLCPTASSASSAVCGEGTGSAPAGTGTPPLPQAGTKSLQHITQEKELCAPGFGIRHPSERCTFPQLQGSGLQQPHGTPERAQEEFCPRMWCEEQRG